MAQLPGSRRALQRGSRNHDFRQPSKRGLLPANTVLVSRPSRPGDRSVDGGTIAQIIAPRYRERELQGDIMSGKSYVVLTAALWCCGLPAWSQELPDGPGKELAAANCNSCHTLSSR